MTTNLRKKPSLDELVQTVTLHVHNPTFLSGLVLPFSIIYVVGFYLWLYEYNGEEYNETASITLFVIIFFHILMFLCCFWSVHLQTFLNFRRVKKPADGVIAKVVPTANNGSSELVRIQKTVLDEEDGGTTFWFMFQKIKYIYDEEKATFRALQFPINKTLKEYYHSKGLENEKALLIAEKTYGKNQMDMVVPEFHQLFIERATAPFFVFQIFSVGLWCLDNYWYYSVLTLCMLIVFECTLVQQQLRNMSEIRKMGNKPYLINVFRNNKWRPIVSDQLVPGDLISIPRSQSDHLVPCDVVIIRGTCIVDESMLTGESVPQMKESLESLDDLSKDYDPEGDGKLFTLFGGTKVVQHTAPTKDGLRAPDSGCIGYVLRSGFNTSQGKLLRTILFGVKRVTENNLETFAFILFLMIFAVSAASYVWIKASADPDRNRYKLFLECTLVLTSIIPPDLPIELSLAVNTSLLQLSKLFVYCTEPFRIPFAGKVQICCFDKTGTLTSDNLMVEGIAGLDEKSGVVPVAEAPENTVQVLATCHSLAQLDDGLVGDPLEKATLTAVDWNLTKQDSVIPKRGKFKALKIYHRYHFSSALKRMSVLAGYLLPFSNEVFYIGAVKGAPEVIMKMLKVVPKDYEKTYLEYSRRGARVLALGIREFGKLDSSKVRELKREEVEKDLSFAGFVVISCPLKPDSKSVIKELIQSSHKVVMITGDNPLTACHVAKELRFTKKTTLILTETRHEWLWQSINGETEVEITKHYKPLVSEYDLCVTGEGLQYLKEHQHDYMVKVLPYIAVFARFAPKQKEFVITSLKHLGYHTLMCGDGTNDVGALKHANVGVSILSNAPLKPPSSKTKEVTNATETNSTSPPQLSQSQAQNQNSANLQRMPRNAVDRRNMNPRERAIMRYRDNMQSTQDVLQKALKELDEDQVVKLGDASIAAPFTSKLSSITCVCHIIKQGRCTLVTTLQMFKILALNALISAYCQSVLYIDGIKFSDTQATLQGLFIAACFLFITRSKPLKTLSKQAPLPNIFNVYTLATILTQFAVHFTALIYLAQAASERSPNKDKKIKLNIDMVEGEEEEFEPNIVNSTVYIICLALQVSTFAVNYKGHPFMESIKENRLLMHSIMISAGVVVILASGVLPAISAAFQIVEFPSDFRQLLIFVLVADVVLAFLADRICCFLFGENRRQSAIMN